MNGDINYLRGILDNLTRRVLKNMERNKVNCKTVTVEVTNLTEIQKSDNSIYLFTRKIETSKSIASYGFS